MNRSPVLLTIAAAALLLSCGPDAATGDGESEDVASTASPPAPTTDVRPPAAAWSDAIVAAGGSAGDAQTNARTTPQRTFTHLPSTPAKDVHCRSPQLCVEAEHRDRTPR